MKDTSVSKGVVGTRGRHLQAVMGIVEAHQPIASVAALSERLADCRFGGTPPSAQANVAALSERPVRGYSNAEEHWCTVALP